MSENEIVPVLLFGNKVFTKNMNLGFLHPQFDLLKTVKGLMNHFLVERNLFDIISRQ